MVVGVVARERIEGACVTSPWSRIARDHPNLVTWFGLSTAFILILAFSARELRLGPRPWLVLALAAVLVAGACARIIAWEADPIPDGPEAQPKQDAQSEERDDAAQGSE